MINCRGVFLRLLLVDDMPGESVKVSAAAGKSRMMAPILTRRYDQKSFWKCMVDMTGFVMKIGQHLDKLTLDDEQDFSEFRDLVEIIYGKLTKNKELSANRCNAAKAISAVAANGKVSATKCVANKSTMFQKSVTNVGTMTEKSSCNETSVLVGFLMPVEKQPKYEDSQFANKVKNVKDASCLSGPSKIYRCHLFPRMEKRCFYCRKVGHIIADCRHRNKSCVRCGNSSHHIALCPLLYKIRASSLAMNPKYDPISEEIVSVEEPKSLVESGKISKQSGGT